MQLEDEADAAFGQQSGVARHRKARRAGCGRPGAPGPVCRERRGLPEPSERRQAPECPGRALRKL